jgi:hypothetical protein
MKKVALTRELHTRLKKRGYKYLLITDVTVSDTDNLLYTMTLKPDRVIPASQMFSCTGIDDALVTGSLGRNKRGCSLMVEVPES